MIYSCNIVVCIIIKNIIVTGTPGICDQLSKVNIVKERDFNNVLESCTYSHIIRYVDICIDHDFKQFFYFNISFGLIYAIFLNILTTKIK